MRCQIGDEQHWVAGGVPDVDPRRGAVSLVDPTRDRERHVDPLIVLDSSVHLRVDQHGLLAFPEGPGLELDPRRVDVRVDDAQAVFDGFGPDDKQHDRAIAVDGEPPRSRFHGARGRCRVPLPESIGLGKLRRAAYEEHLGLRLTQERLHLLAELLHLLLIGRRQLGPRIRKAHVLASCRHRQNKAQQRDDPAKIRFMSVSGSTRGDLLHPADSQNEFRAAELNQDSRKRRWASVSGCPASSIGTRSSRGSSPSFKAVDMRTPRRS